jgi:hypothetical protein
MGTLVKELSYKDMESVKVPNNIVCNKKRRIK